MIKVSFRSSASESGELLNLIAIVLRQCQRILSLNYTQRDKCPINVIATQRQIQYKATRAALLRRHSDALLDCVSGERLRIKRFSHRDFTTYADVLRLVGFQISVPARDDARNPAVHIQHHQHRQEEATHRREYHV